jgi:hypothetical protein
MQGLFVIFFAGNGEFLAPSSTTGSQYAATISSAHALTKTVFILSFAGRGLEGPFHVLLFLQKWMAKVIF